MIKDVSGCYMCKPSYQPKLISAEKRYECEPTTIFNCEIVLYNRFGS